MFEISSDVIIEIVEKRSKFITRLIKVKTEIGAKEKLNEIIQVEKGAVHNCYAYRIYSENGNIIERKNDDGEPGGTAGSPMLAVLTGEKIINVLAITTRYFGGIKLGTGGLVSVYKKGVVSALKESGKSEFKILESYEITAPISKSDFILNKLNKEKINILKRDFSENISIKVECEKSSLTFLENIVNEVCGQIKAGGKK